MNYCSDCGAITKQEIPEGDNRERAVCTECKTIHYVNPKVVAGCILRADNKVLLCKRAIEPRYGYWTLPAGFMETGESTMDGAAREAYEEATAKSDNLKLFGLYNIPRISQVYLMYYGDLKDGFAKAGEESLEVALYAEDEIPWDDLAFPVVIDSLRQYFKHKMQPGPAIQIADVHGTPDGNFEMIRQS